MKGCRIEKVDYKESRKIVYDIEVENAHNFYTNGILVHNCMVQVAKKKYFARVMDDEGKRYSIDDPYIKVMGLEIIKSSTPKYSQKYLKEAIPLILDSTEEQLKEWVNIRREEYKEVPLGEIASVAGVSTLEYNIGDKGIPIGARSALVHNKYIKDNNLLDVYTEIAPGDKTKRLYLNEPNPLNSNIVAFLDDSFIEIFKDYIDYETNFEKGFMSPLDIMSKALKWDLNKTTESLDDW